jgi:uncharacterized membrane protein
VTDASGRSSRRAYIDWARGIAVLLMIEAHTLDSWTRPAARHGVAFYDATILGGFAAPLFLWLAGLSVVLSGTRTAARTGSRVTALDAVCRRGLEVFVLAFLFRLQAFIVSPGGHPVTLFRVDILNVMGPSMAAAGLIWACSDRTTGQVALFAALATGVAMITPVVRYVPGVGSLPIFLQWYIRPAGEYTTFTLFPWAGFVFAGGAVGALIAAASDPREERWLQPVLGAVGIGLVVLGFWAAGRPSIYRVSAFWTSSPTWFVIRVGAMMIGLTLVWALAAVTERAGATLGPLERFGRASLFIYWIHVELVYGYTTWGIRHRLPLWGTGLAYLLFCAAMHRAVVLRDRVVSRWRARRGVGPAPQAVTA